MNAYEQAKHEEQRRERLASHLAEAHGWDKAAGHSALQIEHQHALAHLAPEDRRHVATGEDAR